MIKALLFFLVSQASAESLVGTAKSKADIEYIETHQVSYSDQDKRIIKSIVTKYFRKNKQIGFRQADFVADNFMPNLVFKDLVSGETHSVTVNGKIGNLKTYINNKERTTNFKMSKDLVTTASIAKYIYENFDSLQVKDKIVKCLIPNSHRFVDLKIKKESKSESEVVFSVQPASVLLKVFSAKTYVSFNPNTKYWKQYRGFSNLKGKNGKTLDVVIDYVLGEYNPI